MQQHVGIFSNDFYFMKEMITHVFSTNNSTLVWEKEEILEFLILLAQL